MVRKKPGESDDKLIMKFRKKILAEKFLLAIKDRERYQKPSQKRKEEKKERERRMR